MPAAKPRKTPAKKTSKTAAKKTAAKKTTAKKTARAPARPVPRQPGVACCWLIKSEPNAYSIDTLAAHGKTAWEGIRNYQCRNHMRDDMRIGDPVLFYHSNSDPSAVVGLARVASAAYADPTQFDEKSHYHDPKATRDVPRWQLVDFAFVEKFPVVVGLDVLRADPTLAGLIVASTGNRHSITPVATPHFLRIAELARSARARDLLGAT